MEFVPIVVLVMLVKKTVDYFREWLPDTGNKGVQAAAFLSGVAYAFLFKAADFTASIDVGDDKLSDLNSAATVIFGLAVGAGAGVVTDFIERRNPTPDAKTEVDVEVVVDDV